MLAAVFIPSAFLSGLQGEFYRQFALTIAISTILSAINSLTLSPALAAILLKPHHEAARSDALTRVMDRLLGGFFRRFNRFFDRASNGYVGAVRRARAAGVRTGLVSNSWGRAIDYDRTLLEELFDGVVISGDEGMRKPAPEIYALGAERIGLGPEECVFVDDLPGNLKPARAMGMATVRHTTAEETISELEGLLGVVLR